jgi:hypothetical protein
MKKECNFNHEYPELALCSSSTPTMGRDVFLSLLNQPKQKYQSSSYHAAMEDIAYISSRISACTSSIMLEDVREFHLFTLSKGEELRGRILSSFRGNIHQAYKLGRALSNLKSAFHAKALEIRTKEYIFIYASLPLNATYAQRVSRLIIQEAVSVGKFLSEMQPRHDPRVPRRSRFELDTLPSSMEEFLSPLDSFRNEGIQEGIKE